jgi:anti-sigma factor RsiW
MMRGDSQELSMVDCAYKSSLEPYHDGELDPERSRAFERHLHECAACSHELQKMHELCGLLMSARPREIEPGELARIHDAVEDVANRSIFRFAVGLSAVAASILIISSAWLYDGPAPGRFSVKDSRPSPQAWETWASTGRIEVPAGPRETGVAEADTIQWMNLSLGDRPSHDNR